MSHVTLYPEFNAASSNNGHAHVVIYDKESDPEIGARKVLGDLHQSPTESGWNMFVRLHTGATYTEETFVGHYHTIHEALRDLAYLCGQYWSPNRP